MSEKTKNVPVTYKKTGHTTTMPQKKDQQNKKPSSEIKEQSSLNKIEQEPEIETKKHPSQPIKPSIESFINSSNTTDYLMAKEQKQIENLADFLGDFYRSGNKKKSLSCSILSKLQKNSLIDKETRKKLLEIAEKNDPTLEKSLNLITLATNLSGNENIRSMLCFFAADVGRSILKESEKWLPEPKKDDNKFDLTLLFREASQKRQSINETKKSSNKKTELKKLENSFYLACQWHLFLNRDINPYYLVKIFYQYFLTSSTNQPDYKINSNLIHFFTNSLVFDDESIGLSWLLDIQQQEIEKAKRQSATDEKRANQLEKDKTEIEKKLKDSELLSVEMNQKISELEEQILKIKEESRIKVIHSNDDLSQFRGKSLKFFDSELPLLQDALTALERDPPKTAIAREYVGNVIEKMSKEISRIKEH